MNKILAFLLAVIMTFSLCTVAFAHEKTTPVIVVSGMNAFPLTNERGEQVYPPSGDKIVRLVSENIGPLVEFAMKSNWQKLGDEIIPDVYEDLFAEIRCNDKGESINNLGTLTFQKSVDNYPEYFENSETTVSEIGIIKGLIDDIGAENVYFFNYDWRLDPLKHADDLKAFIENVKKEKNCDKVTLIPCSMGGAVTNSYLYKYGNDNLEKIVYTMAAIQGIDSVGEVFQRKIDVEIYWLMEYLFSIQKDDLAMQILISAIASFTEITPCITNFADNFIKESLEELNDRVYDELMVDSLGTLPGLWAMVPCSYYDRAKEIFFGGKISDSFEKVIDEYNYGVQANARELMQAAVDNGVQVYVLASYGFAAGPYTNKTVEQSDGVIETANQSGWANITPYTMKFTEDSVCRGTVCNVVEHNHFSADRVIDASTCFFPENTWFIKYNKHVGMAYGTDCQKLMNYIVTSDDYVNVHTDEAFPQFMSYSKITGKLTSLTGPEYVYDISDSRIPPVFRLLEIMKTLFTVCSELINT